MDTEFDAELTGEAAGSKFTKLYQGQPASRLVLSSPHFGVLVDIAPLVIGHVLILPRRKAFSFASLSDREWDDWVAVRKRVIDALVDEYGKSVTLMEHGSAPGVEANACILHAHMHVLPLPESVQFNFAQDGLSARPIDPARLRETVSPGSAYFFAEHNGRSAALAEVTRGNRPPSQYLRRVVQRQIGDPDEYDWGVSVEKERLRTTVRALNRHWSS